MNLKPLLSLDADDESADEFEREDMFRLRLWVGALVINERDDSQRWLVLIVDGGWRPSAAMIIWSMVDVKMSFRFIGKGIISTKTLPLYE